MPVESSPLPAYYLDGSKSTDSTSYGTVPILSQGPSITVSRASAASWSVGLDRLAGSELRHRKLNGAMSQYRVGSI
jgi:hypothetical protein